MRISQRLARALLVQNPQSAYEDTKDVIARQLLEHKDAATGEEGRVDAEGWVLGRRRDERECAGLDNGKESILLRLVESLGAFRD